MIRSRTLPKLDNRLKLVASSVRSRTHADIGSDHGHLLVALLRAGRIEMGIAVENKRQPFENSSTALAGLNAVVRFADGLAGLQAGEADSLSICGMGGETIVKILMAHPDRVPPIVIVQPNRKPELLRVWGLDSGFHLVDEIVSEPNWSHHVLRFEYGASRADTAYDGLELDAAVLFGPLNIKRRVPSFLARLNEEREYLLRLERRSEASDRRLRAIERVIG